ncbi:prepilin-type N-terminal cleavage/methylation domain-containing protein [Prosthecobacter sp.]|uniref:prepilin-type N-terminal cleavage/methylation domain-containing protein n=1 Tax=Prosthecobacter sp. TaxID=1965333 RepID=UPI002ABC15A2|nr:prepilin-type N-terminal cleavage/methylation domain-containing protein [Prosthecobacter sp.]MDZ4403816.1 prepilin-type N-terminal cleavage/methylation domain-containing protein [Prosthecobacter sp.]
MKQPARLFRKQAGSLHHAAFTLLEVILAMALVSLVLGGVYGIANGVMSLGKSMNNARVAETRISNFVTQWRDYLETMPPGIQLTAGAEKVARGASGNLFILGGKMPFTWNRALKLADAVEFGLVRNKDSKDLSLVVRHLKLSEKAGTPDQLDTIAELPILDGLKQMQWQFYEPEEKKWFTSWDPKKRPQPPLFMKLKFAFTTDPREHEYTFWIANDLSQVTAPQVPPPSAPATPPRI